MGLTRLGAAGLRTVAVTHTYPALTTLTTKPTPSSTHLDDSDRLGTALCSALNPVQWPAYPA